MLKPMLLLFLMCIHFGPTFRAENSNTSRHLAEFWMIEPELAFADLNDDMACATAYLQYVVRYVLEICKEDMDFFNTWIEKGIVDRLNDVAEKEFVQLTYTDAIELLLRANKKFEFPISSIQYRKMDFEEFCSAAISVHQLEGMESWEQHARRAYELFEKDGNRPIMIEELASELGLSPSVPVHVVLQDWIRHSDGKLSFLGFVRLLHGVSSRAFQRA